jgi:hypothetical protein
VTEFAQAAPCCLYFPLQSTWNWLDSVKMKDSSGLLVDGLDSACAPSGAYWTYNQVSTYKRRKSRPGLLLTEPLPLCSHLQGIYVRFAVEMFLHLRSNAFLSAAQVCRYCT